MTDQNSNPEQELDLDRFQAIFNAWSVEKADLSEDYDENQPLKHLLADVWLNDAELDDLEERSIKKGGFVDAYHRTCR